MEASMNLPKMIILLLVIISMIACSSDKDDPVSPVNEVPVLTTVDVSAITQTTAQSGGNITSNGGASVTARGVCWSTNQTPTTTDNKTSDGTGVGSFTSSITGLTVTTTYYVRAYATNSVGTGYGSTISFTTDNASLAGIEWTSRSPGTSGWDDIVWTGSQFVAVNTQGSSVGLSDDGITWQMLPGPNTSTIAAYQGHLSVHDGPNIYHSIDGIRWDTLDVRYNGEPVNFWDNENFSISTGFLAYGFANSNNLVLTGTDGISWSIALRDFSVPGGVAEGPAGVVRVPPSQYGGGDLVYGDNQFVYVLRADSAGMIFTSPAGSTWTLRDSIPPTPLASTRGLWSVAFSGDLYVAVGAWGTISTSPDGITWTLRNSGTTRWLRSVSWSSQLGRFVIVGDGGTILS